MNKNGSLNRDGYSEEPKVVLLWHPFLTPSVLRVQPVVICIYLSGGEICSSHDFKSEAEIPVMTKFVRNMISNFLFKMALMISNLSPKFLS